MKKLKLVPFALMFVLCVGILAFGIYAITPNTNTIKGTITVNPGNAAVDIEAWVYGKEDTTKQTLTNLRAGGETIDFTGMLTMDQSGCNYIEEVDEIILKVKVINNSSKQLGAYFLSGEQPESGYAELSNVLTEVTTNTYYDIYLDFYSHIGPASDDATTDEVTLNIVFIPKAWLESSEALTENFTFQLNIEEYQPNVSTATIAETSTDFSNKLVKLSKTYDVDGT